MRPRQLALALSLALLVAPARAGEVFKGVVVHVADGDTLTVLHDGREERVRLTSIDCPERGQAFGRRSQNETTALAMHQAVTVVTEGPDRYGRTLGEVLLPDGHRLNRMLGRYGCCWWFRRYSKDPQLAELEAQARAAKRGL